jgi:hypothetical protein
MTKTAEQERAAVVAWTEKRAIISEDFASREKHPATKRQWQADADFYRHVGKHVERGDHIQGEVS